MPPSQIRYRIFGRDDLVDRNQMRDLIRRGEVDSFTDVATEGSEEWRRAGDHAELQRYFSLAAGPGQPLTQPTRQSKSSWAVALLLIAIGFVVAASSVNDLLSGMASSRWPSTEARLIYAQVSRQVIRSRRSARSTRRESTWYTLSVSYEYSVNGQSYHSNAISFGSELTGALLQRSRIQAAKPLPAYYDPAIPSRAVLHPGVTAGPVFRFLLGLAALGCGGVIAFVPGVIRRVLDKISTVSTIRLGR